MKEPILKLNILIVEDNPDDAELVILELRRRGFEFEYKIVETEADFLTGLSGGKWDTIICDYSMPSFDALRALEILRNEMELDIPFILVSGTVGEEVAVEAMRNGADDYVMKDNLKRLGVAVERELKSHEHRKEKKWAEQKYRLLFENSPDGVLLCNEDGWIREANNSAGSILGISSKRVSEINFYELLEAGQADTGKVVKMSLKDQGYYRGELSIKNVEGNELPIALSAGLVQGNNGRRLASFIFTDISERIKTQEKLKSSLQEKQVLLSEVHHRVKNNMAIISGLLYMQSQYVDDSKAQRYFREGMSRIKSMATVHEMLYRSETFDRIDFGMYIRNLVDFISESIFDHLKDIQIEVDCSGVTMNLNKAIPCGLIVNELITNSYLHAYDEADNGKIEIKMHEQPDHYILDVKDDGQGFNPDQLKDQSESMGMMIINSLVNQLKADMNITSKNGTRIRMEIPAE